MKMQELCEKAAQKKGTGTTSATNGRSTYEDTAMPPLTPFAILNNDTSSSSLLSDDASAMFSAADAENGIIRQHVI